MQPSIISRDQAAKNLAVPMRILLRYEQRGLVHCVRHGEVEGFAPAEIRRLWTIVSFQRDLGINLAGVEALLKLQDHVAEIHQRLDRVTAELRAALEAEAEGNG